MKRVNNITCWLFPYRGRYWWRNIKDIPLLFKRIIFTLKHGYAPQARWETFAWFIDTMIDILKYNRDNRSGDFYVQAEDYEGYDHEQVNKVYDKMIDLLYAMDECNPLYENWNYEEKNASMDNAKEEFFKLFNKYFYDLWD